MRLLTAALALGLVTLTATAQDPPKGKATVTVVGQFTADKDTTLNYVLKKGGKVVAEEKGLSALPGKGIEVTATDAAGPFELTISATGGVLKIGQIGLAATADGKQWKGMFGGKLPDLNAKDAGGSVVRAVSPPITLTAVKAEKKPDDDKKKPDDKKKDDKKASGGGSNLSVAPLPRVVK